MATGSWACASAPRSSAAAWRAARNPVVVGEASDGEEAVERARRLRPDVVLMDVRMPRLNGIEATRRITAAPEPRPRVLVLTTFDLDEYVYEALRAGAGGFLLKDAPEDHLVSGIRIVAEGGALLDPAVTRRLIEQPNAEIAEDLIVSDATVKTHVARVLGKLGLRDRTQAVIYAYESGLVQPGAPR